MKTTPIAAALALALGTSAAQGASITVTQWLYYTSGGAASTGFGGLNTTIVGTLNSNANGSFNSGTTPYFGAHWTADQVVWFDTHNTPLTWSGATNQGSFNYNFTLTGNQVAAGVLWDWGTTTDIPLLAAFDCGPNVGDPCTPVDTENDGTPGTDMVTAPVPGGTWAISGIANDAFPDSGTTVVPVPAAVWLFGSGLLGLVGVARRKKTQVITLAKNR